MPVHYVLPSKFIVQFNERFQFYTGDTNKQLAAYEPFHTEFPNTVGLWSLSRLQILFYRINITFVFKLTNYSLHSDIHCD